MERHTLAARTKDTAIDLVATPVKPPVMHGTDGIVPKGENRDDYYMSFTRPELTGTLVFKGKEMPVTGTVWFDHEFGYMGTTAVSGGDWFSLAPQWAGSLHCLVDSECIDVTCISVTLHIGFVGFSMVISSSTFAVIAVLM